MMSTDEMENVEGLVPVMRAADMVGVSRGTVKNWVSKGWIDGKMVYGKMWVREDQIEAANRRSLLSSPLRKRKPA
jgi:hypothetical protein